MKFEKQNTVESKVFPGVSFTIRVLGEPARARVEVETAAPRERQRELVMDYMEIQQEIDEILPPIERPPGASTEEIIKAEKEQEDALPKEQAKQWRRLKSKRTAIDMLHQEIFQAEIAPLWLKAGFVSATGIEENKKTTAVEDIINGDRKLFTEIALAIWRRANMSAEEVKNYESPSSSAAVEDGTTNDTTAPNASGTDGTN